MVSSLNDLNFLKASIISVIAHGNEVREASLLALFLDRHFFTDPLKKPRFTKINAAHFFRKIDENGNNKR